MSTVETSTNDLPTLDKPPAGWHVLSVARSASRSRDWLALMISVDPADLKNCECDFPAKLWVHPKEYRPGPRRALQCWVRVPGKHRSESAAFEAAETMAAVKH
ncbi:MAG: hypothetical protein EWM45_06650 [Rhodopseudomonas palustris]|nr:MAG: hypothetical protein EWM45_06650 [Rhodopseudomonas palustris]